MSIGFSSALTTTYLHSEPNAGCVHLQEPPCPTGKATLGLEWNNCVSSEGNNDAAHSVEAIPCPNIKCAAEAREVIQEVLESFSKDYETTLFGYKHVEILNHKGCRIEAIVRTWGLSFPDQWVIKYHREGKITVRFSSQYGVDDLGKNRRNYQEFRLRMEEALKIRNS